MINKITFKSRKILRKNQRTYDLVTSIKNTRKSIDGYYSQEISSDALIKILNQLEFFQTQNYTLASSIIIGIITGALSSMALSLGDFKRTNIIAADIILTLIVMIFCWIVAVCTVMFVYCRLKKLYMDNYTLYIIPYECNVIKQKLQIDYKIQL